MKVLVFETNILDFLEFVHYNGGIGMHICSKYNFRNKSWYLSRLLCHFSSSIIMNENYGKYLNMKNLNIFRRQEFQ